MSFCDIYSYIKLIYSDSELTRILNADIDLYGQAEFPPYSEKDMEEFQITTQNNSVCARAVAVKRTIGQRKRKARVPATPSPGVPSRRRKARRQTPGLSGWTGNDFTLNLHYIRS